MRDNYNIMLMGLKICLVPYREKFVERYHNWMKDPFLLQTTASEPLSLEEEYDMQKSWCNDSNKCTFIVLVNDNNSSNSNILTEDNKNSITYNNSDSINNNKDIENMCGDVNLFLNDIDNKFNAEIEVMIAESQHRGKGFAKEAVFLMMSYGINKIGINRFYAKINKDNEISINLFRR